MINRLSPFLSVSKPSALHRVNFSATQEFPEDDTLPPVDESWLKQAFVNWEKEIAPYQTDIKIVDAFKERQFATVIILLQKWYLKTNRCATRVNHGALHQGLDEAMRDINKNKTFEAGAKLFKLFQEIPELNHLYPEITKKERF